MKHTCFLICMLASILIVLLSCQQEKPHRSFYYWKTTFHLSEIEKQALTDLHISKLYIRFFDVDWDEVTNQVIPLAKIRFKDKTESNYTIVPVIYIVNKALLNTGTPEIPVLASKIYKEIGHIASQNQIQFNEIQIDCDWSESTKDKYFNLLNIIKSELEKSNKTLSATIRLHQVKYKNITGVPPVDRGMLMFYNMGKFSPAPATNSIYNEGDAGKYLANLSQYPLPLDIALPAFTWGVHFRKDRVIELLNNMNRLDFERNANFTQMEQNLFVASKSFYFNGFYFMKDDVVKTEEITPDLSIKAARQLNRNLKKEIGTIAIFHLDSLIITQYEKKDFEKIYHTFN